MARTIIPLALLLLGIGCTVPAAESVTHNIIMPIPPTIEVSDSLSEQEPATWKILPKETGTLVFGEKDTLRTGLRDLQLLKEFNAPSGMPWYLFKARIADKGQESKLSMYILCPDMEMCSKAIGESWHMPGRLFDGPDQDSYYEAQVFAGEVLRDTIGVIWYDRSLMPDGNWKKNTVLLNLTGPVPDTLVLFGHGRKSSTIDLAFHGKCELLGSLDQHIRP